MARFKQRFNKYVSAGDSIETEVDGLTYIATIDHDYSYSVDDDDVHTITDDMYEDQVARIESALEALDNGEWFYCFVTISLWCDGVLINKNVASVGGVEANYPGSANRGLSDIADDLLPEATKAGEMFAIKLQAALSDRGSQ